MFEETAEGCWALRLKSGIYSYFVQKYEELC